MSVAEMVAVEPDIVAETPAISPDEAQISAAREELSKARESHENALKSVIEAANEYCKAQLPDEDEMDLDPEILKALTADQKVGVGARKAQMKDVTKWYQFWQTAGKLPKDNKYETYAGERVAFKDIIKQNEEFLRKVADPGVEGGDELAAEEKEKEVTWKYQSAADGMSLYSCVEKTDVKMYKLVTNFNKITPRAMLTALVRGPLLGKEDADLVYFREHYNFVGGRTSLVHFIRKIAENASITQRDFFVLSHWTEEEDGTIYFTMSSVNALESKIPDTVRGAIMLQGFCLKPTANGGTEVVFVSQVNPKGWVLNAVLEWTWPAKLRSYVKAVEAAGRNIAAAGEDNIEVAYKKYVLREINN